MRRLIINADDFGLTHGVNRAILEASQAGVVTSTTLMANGTAFADAVRLAKSSPKLSLGCHIVLTDGLPVLDAWQVSTLLETKQPNESGQPAEFRKSLNKFIGAALIGRLKADEIEAEATAQIRKLQSSGIEVTHFDSHKHTHLFPQVLRPLLRAAKACGVRAVRNPFGPIRFQRIASHPRLWKRYGQVKVLCLFARRFRETIEKAGLKTPDGTVGIIGTGVLNEDLLKAIVNDLPLGTWEFVCHPGYNDAELQNVRTRLKESRFHELQVLTSPGTRELIVNSGIELISYQDFAGSAA